MMKKLDLNLKLSLSTHASESIDIPDDTPNNFDSKSPFTFDFGSPKANIPQDVETDLRIGSGSGGVNQQYGYAAPASGGTTVVGVPAVAVYMNQMELVNNNEPILQLAPPGDDLNEGGESSDSNSNSAPAAAPAALPVPPAAPAALPVPPAAPALTAAQANFFNGMMTRQIQNVCMLCNVSETPMWRRGPHGPKTLCNACGIKYHKEAKKKKEREGGSTSGSK